MPNFVPSTNPDGVALIGLPAPKAVAMPSRCYSELVLPNVCKSLISGAATPFKAWVDGSNPSALTKTLFLVHWIAYLPAFSAKRFWPTSNPITTSRPITSPSRPPKAKKEASPESHQKGMHHFDDAAENEQPSCHYRRANSGSPAQSTEQSFPAATKMPTNSNYPHLGPVAHLKSAGQ